MYHYKPTTYEKMEKQPKEKKFKQNSYEEIRKIVEDGEDTNKVKEIKNKKKTIMKNHIILNYLIKYNLIFIFN